MRVTTRTNVDRESHWRTLTDATFRSPDDTVPIRANPIRADASVPLWAVLAPRVLNERAAEYNQRVYEHFERVAGIMGEMRRRAGLPAFDGGSIAKDLARVITTFQDRIRVEEALRTVIIASPEAVRTAPQATAAVSKGRRIPEPALW
jgi:hypothetical protein